MEITKIKAIFLGAVSIIMAICCQLFNDLTCYRMDILEALTGLWFPSIPLIPAIISLLSKNPLRAIPASLCVIPFYMFAYYVDCGQPYSGGGASMVYVTVILFGTPLAFVAALITDNICRTLNIEISEVNTYKAPLCQEKKRP